MREQWGRYRPADLSVSWHTQKTFITSSPVRAYYWSDPIDWTFPHVGRAVLVWYQLNWSLSLQSSLKCRTDRLVVKAQTSSVSIWHLLSSAASPQFNSKEPLLSFLVSALSWSEELCLFLSIFSLYLQCSSYRGKKSLSLCFPSSVSHISPSLSYPLHFVFTAFTHSFNVPFTFSSPSRCYLCHHHRSQTERFNTLSIGSSSPQTATCSTHAHACTQTVYYRVRLGRQRRRQGVEVNLWMLLTQITMRPTYPPLKQPPHSPHRTSTRTYL